MKAYISDDVMASTPHIGASRAAPFAAKNEFVEYLLIIPILYAGPLAGVPAVHAGDCAGAAHPDHDHRLLRHLQEAPLFVQLQRLPQQVVSS